MAEPSTFRGIIYFFDRIGIYDVVLPFILVFTIVYAILEKTKVLGTEEIQGVKYTRKNLNAMTAFAISFLVVASSKLVAIIANVSSQMVVLLLASVFFLLLVGVFYKESEEVALEGRWRTLFMIIMFVGLLLIFLQAIPTKSGQPWLEWFWNYIGYHWSSTGVASIILIIGIIIFIWWVQKPAEETSKKEKKE
ncbi:hypothetical protein JW707_00125 [Candidatus Woesearchaeota archaeon]|nr:hypothetical protein [Candidatus Woesearchaeota archaeon]